MCVLDSINYVNRGVKDTNALLELSNVVYNVGAAAAGLGSDTLVAAHLTRLASVLLATRWCFLHALTRIMCWYMRSDLKISSPKRDLEIFKMHLESWSTCLYMLTQHPQSASKCQ